MAELWTVACGDRAVVVVMCMCVYHTLLPCHSCIQWLLQHPCKVEMDQ